MYFRLNNKYLSAFIIIFAIEAMIAVFAKDNFIRTHLGDILVVILIYCFIKTFVRKEVKLLPVYIFIFAVLVEIGQYFNLVKFLGLSDYLVARIIIGTTFDISDIACYFVGCMLLWFFERRFRNCAINPIAAQTQYSFYDESVKKEI